MITYDIDFIYQGSRVSYSFEARDTQELNQLIDMFLIKNPLIKRA